MKSPIKNILFAVSSMAFFALATPAFAATPYLSIVNQGSTTVMITVTNADPYASVTLNMRQGNSSLWTEIKNFGTTDGSGYFSQVTNLSSDGSNNPVQAYVVVNGQQSPVVQTNYGYGYGYTGGCTYNCGNQYGLSLSQSNLSLNSGQNSTVTIYNNGSYNYYNNFYISSNSNPNVASTSISGNSVYVYGSHTGSTTISICQSGGNSGCASLYVTVNSGSNCGYYGCSGSLGLSQSSVTLNVGQSMAVIASGSSGGLYISSNSNPSVVSASITSGQVSLYALSSGSSNVYVCAYGSNQCATLYVNVLGSGYSGGSYSNVTFNPSNPSLYVGQSMSVNILNSYASADYYISSNSNSNVVSASISGSAVNLYAKNSGTSNILICQSYVSRCWNLFVTVSGSGSGLSLSQSSVNLNLGQSVAVTASNYYGSLYISSNSNSSVVSASISGSAVNLTALNSGSSTVSVCANSSQCSSIYVTVSGGVLGASNFAVSMVNNSFSPKIITVPLGAVVTWTNNSNMVHTVTADDNSFNSGSLASGQIFSRTFNSAGTFAYHCIFHGSAGGGGMSGIIVVGSGYPGGGSNSISFSQNNLTLNQAQSVAVSVYSNYSSVPYISNNSNLGVVTTSVVGNTINIYATALGTTTLNVCLLGYPSVCGNIYVNVTNFTGSGNGSFYLGQSAVNLNTGQNTQVAIIANNLSGSNFYISSNSNPGVASASISGNTITVYGIVSGTSVVTVCSSQVSQCSSLNVTVNNNTGSLYFITTTLPQPIVGQYYSATLQVVGGSAPYSFILNSGSLPAGLILSNSGQITGVPQSTAAATFFVRTTDLYNRTITASFNLSPSSTAVTPGGLTYPSSVLGASIYNNGTLVSNGSTIYIVYKNTKTGFGNLVAFQGLGFRLGNVSYVDISSLTDSGYVVNTASAAHPWGSWIKSGTTIYFVHESGLIPVSNYSIFLTNGGQNNLVVAANRYDFRLPILSLMTDSDPRLK